MISNIKILESSILDCGADIIVMSANSTLLAGSGVSGVIHKAAGSELEQYAKPLGPLSVGQAIVTPPFNLSAKYVVHTVCPRYLDGFRGEARQLALAYANALKVRDDLSDAASIAFVSMGTGVYKWPVAIATKIAVKELSKSRFKETFICATDAMLSSIYRATISDLKM